MRRSLVLASFIGIAAAADAKPASISLSPSGKKDVNCFIFFAAAAGEAKNAEERDTAGLATLYYLGRIDATAPGLDIAAAVNQEADAYDANAKAIEDSCNAEFIKRAGELSTIGRELQKPQP